jgi:hypothetical protein
MFGRDSRLRAGDWVDVKSPQEIAETRGINRK